MYILELAYNILLFIVETLVIAVSALFFTKFSRILHREKQGKIINGGLVKKLHYGTTSTVILFVYFIIFHFFSYSGDRLSYGVAMLLFCAMAVKCFAIPLHKLIFKYADAQKEENKTVRWLRFFVLLAIGLIVLAIGRELID